MKQETSSLRTTKRFDTKSVNIGVFMRENYKRYIQLLINVLIMINGNCVPVTDKQFKCFDWCVRDVNEVQRELIMMAAYVA